MDGVFCVVALCATTAGAGLLWALSFMGGGALFFVVCLSMDKREEWAFPYQANKGQQPGMTLRAWIAGQAAAALDAADLASCQSPERSYDPVQRAGIGWVAKRAVALADAVIEELGRE